MKEAGEACLVVVGSQAKSSIISESSALLECHLSTFSLPKDWEAGKDPSREIEELASLTKKEMSLHHH